MKDQEFILEAAKEHARQLAEQRRLPRFRRVVAKLQRAGLLLTNTDCGDCVIALPLNDFLWAGEIEPRVLELLPALILKKPSFFVNLDKLPNDLSRVLREIRNNRATSDFRGIPASSYTVWITRIGHKGKEPTLLKSYRLKPADLSALQLAVAHGLSETEAVRRGLQLLKRTLENA